MNQKPSISERSSLPAAGGIRGRQFFRSTRKFARVLLAVVLAGLSAGTVWAQGDAPSGTISGSGSGPYFYTLSFSDGASATSPIGSIWYGWVYPSYNYLPSIPTSASAPSGWTAQISYNSIEFFANSPSSYIQPGHTLSGFSYTATFSPATLASDPYAPYSESYTGGIESDPPGTFFSVTTVVPEPSAAALFALSALGLGLARWRRLRAKA